MTINIEVLKKKRKKKKLNFNQLIFHPLKIS